MLFPYISYLRLVNSFNLLFSDTESRIDNLSNMYDDESNIIWSNCLKEVKKHDKNLNSKSSNMDFA